MNYNGMKVFESNLAVKQNGTEEKEIQVQRGGWLERLFDPDPTLPLWQKTKTKVIQVPHYEPVIYRMLDKIIVHPSLMPKILDLIKNQSSIFKWTP